MTQYSKWSLVVATSCDSHATMHHMFFGHLHHHLHQKSHQSKLLIFTIIIILDIQFFNTHTSFVCGIFILQLKQYSKYKSDRKGGYLEGCGDDAPSSKCLTWAILSIFFHQFRLSSGFWHPNIIRCYSRKKSFFMVGWGDFIFFFLLCFGRNVDIICAALSELWILPSQKLLRVSFHRSKIREHLPPATWKMKLAHKKCQIVLRNTTKPHLKISANLTMIPYLISAQFGSGKLAKVSTVRVTSTTLTTIALFIMCKS